MNYNYLSNIKIKYILYIFHLFSKIKNNNYFIYDFLLIIQNKYYLLLA